MIRSIIYLLFLLFFSCAKDNQQSNLTDKMAINEKTKSTNQLNITDELYDLQFDIETTDNNIHFLVISIQLNYGSHFVSPNEKRDFSGKFNVDLGSYNDISFNGKLLETPPSVEEYDPHPFVDGLVNWVRTNTTYKQQLNILSEDDFEVFGRVRFTIEPRCTLEEIPFSISYQDGKIILKNNSKC